MQQIQCTNVNIQRKESLFLQNMRNVDVLERLQKKEKIMLNFEVVKAFLCAAVPEDRCPCTVP